MPRSKLAEPETRPTPERPRPPQQHDLREGYIAIGVALTSFGVRGEIKVEPLTEFAQRFNRGARLWFAGADRTIQRSRWNERGVVVVKLSGIETPEQVAALRGEYLQMPEDQRPPLPEGEYYRDDLLGIAVRTVAGRDLGEVVDLMPTGANDVLVVRGPDGEQLVPLIEDVIVSIDIQARLITIEPLPGLLDERVESPPRQRPPSKWQRRRAARRASAQRTE